MPNLRLEDDGVWNWIETDSTEVDQEPMQQLITRDGDRLMVALEDGTTVLGTVELSEEGVVVAVSSRRRADMAKVMIKASLGSLLSRPTTEIETMDEIAAAMDAEADDELEP